MKKANTGKYKRKNEALLAIARMVPGFCFQVETNSNTSRRMYCFVSSRIGISADTEVSIRLHAYLVKQSFTSVADFDEYLCKLKIDNVLLRP